MKVWYHDPEVKEMCGKLVASMVERVKEAIKAKGSHIHIDYTIKQINILVVSLLLYFPIVPTNFHSTVIVRDGHVRLILSGPYALLSNHRRIPNQNSSEIYRNPAMYSQTHIER
jgi:hypothetical protein